MFYVVKRSTVAEIKKVTLESWSFCKILFNAIGFKALPLKGKISLKHSAVMIQVDQLILQSKVHSIQMLKFASLLQIIYL